MVPAIWFALGTEDLHSGGGRLWWILGQRGLRRVRHYLDDFIVVSLPDSPKCQEDLDIMCHTCGELGLPLAEEKQVGPSTQLVFLGIELDTVHMEIRPSAEKLLQVTKLVASWSMGTGSARSQ